MNKKTGDKITFAYFKHAECFGMVIETNDEQTTAPLRRDQVENLIDIMKSTLDEVTPAKAGEKEQWCFRVKFRQYIKSQAKNYHLFLLGVSLSKRSIALHILTLTITFTFKKNLPGKKS